MGVGGSFYLRPLVFTQLGRPGDSGRAHSPPGRMLGQVGDAGEGAIGRNAAHLGPRPPVLLSPLLAAPDSPPCRRPRPGPARPGSVRSACAAAAAAAAAAAPPPARAAALLRAPPGPPPARRPRRPCRLLRRGPPRCHTPGHACDAQLHPRGAEVASHTPTLPHIHWVTCNVTHSPHPHTVSLPRMGVTQGQTFKLPYAVTQCSTLEQCVTHYDTLK
jgi:hypothetical protein